MSTVRPPERDPAGQSASAIEVVGFSRDGWTMLLAMLAAVTPLIAVAVLQVAVDLSQLIVGIVVAVSLVLIGAVTLIFRPKTEDGTAAQSTNGVRPGPKFSFDDQGDSLGPIPRDTLTNLPTFQPFSRRLYEEFQFVQHAGGSLAVVLVDINGLTKINEEFGPEVGDEVLRHVTVCLQASKRMNDVVARMGDDEFGMLLLDCDPAGAKAFVERVQAWLARESIPVESKKRSTSLWIGVCAGFAVCDERTPDADDAITRAVDDLNEARSKRDRLRSNWERAS